VLGYDVDRSVRSPKLVLNRGEAEQVREIFAIYLRTGSLIECTRQAVERGFATKRIVTRAGRTSGGDPFCRSTLYTLLVNRIYRGEISHKGEWFPGEHAPIVDGETFDAVQDLLQQNGRLGGNDFRNRYNALLKQVLRCKHCDSVMTHVFQGKDARKYRYYTCASALRLGRKTCPQPTLPALEIEQLVVDELRRYCKQPDVRRAVRASLARGGQPSDGRLAALLADFEAVWATLEPKEQVELVRLAISHVDFDSGDSSIEVVFRGEDLGTAASQGEEAAA
jgi:site-specific DNA recombinase